MVLVLAMSVLRIVKSCHGENILGIYKYIPNTFFVVSNNTVTDTEPKF